MNKKKVQKDFIHTYQYVSNTIHTYVCAYQRYYGNEFQIPEIVTSEWKTGMLYFGNRKNSNFFQFLTKSI